MELTAEKKAELINYITDARAAKKKEKEITKSLLNAGWQEKDVLPIMLATKPKSKISPAVLFLIFLALVSFTTTGIILYMAFR